MTNRNSLATWVFLNGIGMALAFLTFLHALIGFAIGACAAAVSGRSLFGSISTTRSE